jgi:snurportin-1
MRPEWLVDIPNDLARAWCVLPRPEGRRELVVASRGRTAARAKTGGVSRRFASALPGGSRRTKHGKAEGDFCILDCVFHAPDATYYVLDTLAWNGVSLYDCAAEMRAAWTHAKLGHPETAECPEAGTVSVDETDASAGNAFRFSPLPVYDADARGIRNAYDGVPVPFQRDGLLFLAKDGAYELGVTPLAALWKDKRCSRHFLEENPGKADPERQRLVLSLDATTGDVVTGDAAPVALARLPLEYVAPEDGGTAPPGGGLRDGALVKFAMGDGGVFFSEDGGVLGADLVYEGLANQRRGHGADAVTKILFQYNARRNPITVEELCDAAEEQTRLGDAHAESANRAKLFDSLP